MAPLAQAYLHLKPYSVTPEQLRALGRATEILATEAASDAYDVRVTVEVEITEGSVVGRATIYGTIIGAYAVVADYKGFKESSHELVQDARYVSGLVIDGLKKIAQPTAKQVYHAERRTKTPGKVYRIAQRLEKLDSGADQLNRKAIQQELADIADELDKVRRDLTPVERKAIAQSLHEYKRLPPLARWPRKGIDVEADRLAHRPPEEELAFFDENELLGLPGEAPPSKKPTYHTRVDVEPSAKPKDKQLPNYENRLQEIVQKARSSTALTPLRGGQTRRGRGRPSMRLIVKPEPESPMKD
jgi:hypothetical protein